MVDVVDLKAKVKVEDDNATTILDKLETALENIVDKLDDMDQGLQEMAKRGAESMGFLGHSMAFAFGGIIKDSVKWLINTLDEAWENSKQLAQNLDKLHFGTGMDILSLQRMKAVLEQNGVSFEDFLGSLGRYQDMIARMRYNQLSKDEIMAFGELGINPREYKTAESLLQAVGNQLNRIGDINRRNFLASKLKISPETLRGLTVSGWYDEFAALTDKEKDTMSEYARLSKALDQEKSALFTKLVSKFVTKDGIEIEKTLLKIGGVIGENIDKANTLGEVFVGLTGKIGKFFEYDPKDSALMSAFKTLGQIGTGWSYIFSEGYDSLDKGLDWLGEKIFNGTSKLGETIFNIEHSNQLKRQRLENERIKNDLTNSLLNPSNPENYSQVQNSYGGNSNTTINNTKNFTITTTDKVDHGSIVDAESMDGGTINLNSTSYGMAG